MNRPDIEGIREVAPSSVNGFVIEELLAYITDLERELHEAREGFTDYAETAGASLRELRERLAQAEELVRELAYSGFDENQDPRLGYEETQLPIGAVRAARAALAEWEGK